MEQKHFKNQGARKAIVGTFHDISAIWLPSQVPLDGWITDSYRKMTSRTADPPKPSLAYQIQILSHLAYYYTLSAGIDSLQK